MIKCQVKFFAFTHAVINIINKVFLTVQVLTQAGKASSAIGNTMLKFKNPFKK